MSGDSGSLQDIRYDAERGQGGRPGKMRGQKEALQDMGRYKTRRGQAGKTGNSGRRRTVRYPGIDYFRMAAALMVVAIHIAPFSGWSKEADFLLTYCAGRVAVPFFFMTTGYFVLAAYVRSGFCRKRSFCKYLLKTTGLYLAVTVLYLPLTIYAGNLPHGIGGFLKAILFGGICYL